MDITNISDYISAPLEAVATSQARLAQVTQEFIMNYMQEVDGSANDEIEPQYVEFSYNILDTQGDTAVTNKLRVPLLSIINIPSLKITETNIDLVIEVAETVVTETESNGSGSGKFRLYGYLSSKTKTNRETNTNSNYSVSIKAVDDGMPEGLARVLDTLNNTIGPVMAEED